MKEAKAAPVSGQETLKSLWDVLWIFICYSLRPLHFTAKHGKINAGDFSLHSACIPGFFPIEWEMFDTCFVLCGPVGWVGRLRCVSKSQKATTRSRLCLLPSGFWGSTQVISLGSRHLYLLSHLAGPSWYTFFFPLSSCELPFLMTAIPLRRKDPCLCSSLLKQGQQFGRRVENGVVGFPRVLPVNILICTGERCLKSKSFSFILPTCAWAPSTDGGARARDLGEFDGNPDLHTHRRQPPSQGVKKQNGRKLSRNPDWWVSCIILHLLQLLDSV